MADYAFKAFDMADKYRMPVMIMADGMLGQMMEPVVLPERSLGDLPEKPWATCGHRHKRPHNVVNSLYLTASDLEDLDRRALRALRRHRGDEQRGRELSHRGRRHRGRGLRRARPAWPARAVNAAREQGVKAGLVRPITLWPFPTARHRGARAHGQGLPRRGDEHGPDGGRRAPGGGRAPPVEFFGRTGGVIPTPGEVLAAIGRLEREGRGVAWPRRLRRK